LLLAGAALHALRGGALRVALGALAAKAVLELAVISRAGLVRDAAWAGAATITLLLAFAVLRARTDRETLDWLLLALVLAGAGLALQAGRLTLHPYFNHNDACHVLLTAALEQYRAGLRLRDCRTSLARSPLDLPARAPGKASKLRAS
jgi:hypothetical protein